jgi:Arc/MetJ-type ribon-helix-helix transcriptional regulator
MARLTFRADDELIRQLEEMDASQSEVIREALRQYLSINNSSQTQSNSPSNAQQDRKQYTHPPLPNINIKIYSPENKQLRSESSEEKPTLSSSSFCSCGNEIRESWAFCPDCGCRTAKKEI